MGKYIGGQINSRKQTIGIVVGRKDTEAAASAVRGLTDALEGSDCQILWHYYQEKDQDVCEKVKEKKIKNRLYKMESHETEVKIMDQDTKLLDDEIERFLYSYE